ncbi:acyltransferase family protein [Massilia sp. PAMC28688]|uniref:acyltransferase family protein n=1 Tax=Massilia sp. PAMC28688 TaxID=2861283 RepID=UPI001C625733|nr:acyltransferase family protein [Massilia sp. PAMC28688]QYF92416.1 acyltransferase family protein [Massilia sp. PAMC28688]
MYAAQARLYFIDWLRIIAFFLLILYHVGMYYVSWDWHVKSPAASDAIEPLMMLSSPWRLSLLFLVSGVASSCMLAKIPAGRFARQRSWRLLLPLVFGMLVIVPPQAYFEVIEKLQYQGSYGDFMRLYVSGYALFCKEGDCLDLPTWNHLWFLPYLWVYAMLFALLAARLGPRLDRGAARLARLLAGWRLIVLPAIAVGIIRVLLAPQFPSTHGLFDDWFNHANYFFLFMLGAMMARQVDIWPHVEALRWPAFGLALACWAALIIYYSLPENLTLDPQQHAWRVLMRWVYASCAWCAIVAACGFARRHLNFDNPGRRYLTQAVFPVYIVHQTLIVSIAHLIKPAGIAPPAEALVLVVLTLCISFGVVEAVRRLAPVRPLFGLARSAQGAPGRKAEKPATANC